jgi:dihydrofolate reductase
MIRFIAAIDNKRGIANDHGLPWQGRLPSDVEYYHDKIKNGTLLMGYGLYKELSKPYPGGVNYVAVGESDETLREGFAPVHDAREFFTQTNGDIWNLGGALLFESTLDLADELYITQLEGDFQCTKFFPSFEKDFLRISQGEPITENGITFRFEVWKRADPRTSQPAQQPSR